MTVMDNLMTFDSAHAQPVWEAIRKLGNGRLRSGTLKTRLCAKTGLMPIEVEEAVRELHRRGLLRFHANARGQPVSAYVEYTLDEVPIGQEEAWIRHYLAQEGVNVDTVTAIAPISAKLSGMEEADIRALARCLSTLSRAARTDKCDGPGANVSARWVMGSAKVIARLPAKAMALLGLDTRLQLPSPRYVVHAGPSDSTPPAATLLIENPQAFENAIDAGLADRMSLVCTYGFALAYLGLPKSGSAALPAERPIVLQRCGYPRTIDALLDAPELFFWGDLDIGALKIYQACRSGIPSLRLSGIYRAMEGLLDDPARSHPYVELFDKFGQSKLTDYPALARDIDASVRVLFAKCTRRGVDQETIGASDIARLGALPY